MSKSSSWFRVRRPIRAAHRSTAAGLAAVESAFERVVALEGDDDGKFIEVDLQFHQAIVALLNPRLTSFYDSVIAARQGRAAERLVTVHIDANEVMSLEIVE